MPFRETYFLSHIEIFQSISYPILFYEHSDRKGLNSKFAKSSISKERGDLEKKDKERERGEGEKSGEGALASVVVFGIRRTSCPRLGLLFSPASESTRDSRLRVRRVVSASRQVSPPHGDLGNRVKDPPTTGSVSGRSGGDGGRAAGWGAREGVKRSDGKTFVHSRSTRS